MYRSLALIIWIPLIVGACHRGGTRSDRGSVTDSSKSARVPQGLSQRGHGRESKTARPPMTSGEPKPLIGRQPESKQSHKLEADRPTSAPRKVAPSSRGVPKQSVSKVDQSDVVSRQESVPKAPKVTRESALIGKAASKVARTSSKSTSSEIGAHEATEKSNSPATLQSLPEPLPETPMAAGAVAGGTAQAAGGGTLAAGAGARGESIETGSVAVVPKDTGVPSTAEIVAKPGGENDAPSTVSKTEHVEPEKVVDKTIAPEPVVDSSVNPQVAKSSGTGKTSVGGAAASSSPSKGTAPAKLTQSERKKQTEAQKREETQKAAEQSYEAGLQFIRESRDADAIKAFRQTVKLAPDSADAWLRLAYLCEKEGKTEEAMRAFKEAKRLWSF